MQTQKQIPTKKNVKNQTNNMQKKIIQERVTWQEKTILQRTQNNNLVMVTYFKIVITWIDISQMSA